MILIMMIKKKKALIYFLIYDLNDIKSLQTIEFWIKVILNFKKEEKENNNYVFVIIGNKKDLQNNNTLIINDDNNSNDAINKGKSIANQFDAIFYTTTAKNDKEIKDIIGIAIEKYINSS